MKMESLQDPVQPEIMQPCPLPILPTELVAEILTWLPVDSLLRFRCVSKCFGTLISSPDFVKAHLRRMKSLSKFKPNRAERLIRQSDNFIERQIEPHPFEQRRPFKRCPELVRRRNIWSRVVDWGSHLSSLESLYNDPQVDLVELAEMSDQELDSYCYYADSVVGSCDGLLCSVILPGCYVAVWNPSTRALRALPDDESVDSEKRMLGSHMVFGFGYDCRLDDYKVVTVFIYPDGNGGNGNGGNGNDGTRYLTSVQVFALKTESWRKIEDFQYGAPVGGRLGRFAAGCLHFLVPVYCGGDEWKDTIVALDLATEEYHKVELPDFDEPTSRCELEALVDRLCVVGFNGDVSSEVWVMTKEPGARESWNKLFRFARDDVHEVICSLVYISDNGEVLLEVDDDLIIYSCKDGTIRYPHPASRGSALRDGPAVIYMESLVSPLIEN